MTQSVGHRVASILVRCGNCRIPKYKPLVLTANYTIIMDEYLAGGGNKFLAFKNTSMKKFLGL